MWQLWVIIAARCHYTASSILSPSPTRFAHINKYLRYYHTSLLALLHLRYLYTVRFLRCRFYGVNMFFLRWFIFVVLSRARCNKWTSWSMRLPYRQIRSALRWFSRAVHLHLHRHPYRNNRTARSWREELWCNVPILDTVVGFHLILYFAYIL